MIIIKLIICNKKSNKSCKNRIDYEFRPCASAAKKQEEKEVL